MEISPGRVNVDVLIPVAPASCRLPGLSDKYKTAGGTPALPKRFSDRSNCRFKLRRYRGGGSVEIAGQHQLQSHFVRRVGQAKPYAEFDVQELAGVVDDRICLV